MTNHILYATDKNYCELCAVSLYSLLANFSGKAVIHIIESSLEDRKDDLINVADMFGCDIDFIPIEEISRRLVDAGIPPYRGGYSPYARFFISDYVDEGRVLYLDCDTIIKEDVEPLINFDLNGCPLGAVIDQSSSYVNVLIGHNKHDKYFNSGILLFDVGKCRETNVPESVDRKYLLNSMLRAMKASWMPLTPEKTRVTPSTRTMGTSCACP